MASQQSLISGDPPEPTLTMYLDSLEINCLGIAMYKIDLGYIDPNTMGTAYAQKQLQITTREDTVKRIQAQVLKLFSEAIAEQDNLKKKLEDANQMLRTKAAESDSHAEKAKLLQKETNEKMKDDEVKVIEALASLEYGTSQMYEIMASMSGESKDEWHARVFELRQKGYEKWKAEKWKAEWTKKVHSEPGSEQEEGGEGAKREEQAEPSSEEQTLKRELSRMARSLGRTRFGSGAEDDV